MYKRHGSEFIENTKFMYAHEDIIIPTIMHCRVSTPKEIEFRSKLEFNQYNIDQRTISINTINGCI